MPACRWSFWATVKRWICDFLQTQPADRSPLLLLSAHDPDGGQHYRHPGNPVYPGQMALLRALKGRNVVVMFLMAAALWFFPSIAEVYGYDGFCADLTMACIYGGFLLAVTDKGEQSGRAVLSLCSGNPTNARKNAAANSPA